MYIYTPFLLKKISIHVSVERNLEIANPTISPVYHTAILRHKLW